MFSQKDFFEKILKLFNQYKYLLLVIAAGILLLIIPISSDNADTSHAAAAPDVEFSVTGEEERLEALISSINGVGRVKVMLTLKSGMEVLYADEEQSSSRRSESDGQAGYDLDESVDRKPVILSDGQGGQQPVIIKKVYPQYQGALIVCDGAGSPAVRLSIAQAVSSLLNLGTDTITIAKMKN